MRIKVTWVYSSPSLLFSSLLPAKISSSRIVQVTSSKGRECNESNSLRQRIQARTTFPFYRQKRNRQILHFPFAEYLWLCHFIQPKLKFLQMSHVTFCTFACKNLQETRTRWTLLHECAKVLLFCNFFPRNRLQCHTSCHFCTVSNCFSYSLPSIQLHNSMLSPV